MILLHRQLSQREELGDSGNLLHPRAWAELLLESPALEVQWLQWQVHVLACRGCFLYLVSKWYDGLGNSRKAERVPVKSLKS